MSDFLVKLYELPLLEPTLEKLAVSGCLVRRALIPEKTLVIEWVRRNFSVNWADECDAAFSRQPVACWIATRQQEILGFACYNSIFPGFFGPTGTSEHVRRQGLGRALLLASLHAMRAEGYVYSIIGSGTGAAAFYEKVVGAVEIKGSHPGAYRHMLIALPPAGESSLAADGPP